MVFLKFCIFLHFSLKSLIYYFSFFFHSIFLLKKIGYFLIQKVLLLEKKRHVFVIKKNFHGDISTKCEKR